MKTFKRFLKEQNDLPDYRTVLDYSKQNDLEPVSLFRTARGSTYAHYPDATTVRNRINSQGGFEMQPKTLKTIFMQPDHVSQFGGIHQNADIPTEFKPTGTRTASLHYTANYGPRKAGEKVPGTEFPFETKPRVGLKPVEIWNSSHHKGIHFGSEITGIDNPNDAAGRAGAAGSMLRVGGKLSPSKLDDLIKRNLRNA